MKLPGFFGFFHENLLEPYLLKDCIAIVDGTNLAYHWFKESMLSHNFGCECDKIAKFIKDNLIMFKKANVKCFFIFKGGEADYMEKIQYNKFSNEYTVLLYETFRQSLEEMGIDYTICEFSANLECIAAAQKFNCPLIGFNVEHILSNTAYIPINTLQYNEISEGIDCGLFELKNLYNKFQITKEKLALLIVLKDISLFPEDTFDSFFAYRQLRAPYNYSQVYSHLLQWLSNITFDEAIDQIFKCDFEYKNVTKEKFIEETQRVINFIDRAIHGGIPVQYLYNGNDAQFKRRDMDWFKKGVASKHIAIPYVDLYYSKIIRGFTFTKNEMIDPKLLSIDIIKYAYDLLTNFREETLEGFTLIKYFGELIKPTDVEEKMLSEVKSIRKPMYVAVTNVFENGWHEIKELKLFEYFLMETVQFDFQRLESIPVDVRMLFVSLIYFSRKKGEQNVMNIVYCVLLSYVMLNTDNENDSITIFDSKFKMVKERFTKYSKPDFVYTNLQYNLNQYVICLDDLNYLNILCGAAYKTTTYRKVFNGTLIYNILDAMENRYKGDGLLFIDKILKPCPSAYSYFKCLLDMYNAWMR